MRRPSRHHDCPHRFSLDRPPVVFLVRRAGLNNSRRTTFPRGHFMSEETKQPAASNDPPVAPTTAPATAPAPPVKSRAGSPSFVAHTIEEIPPADGAQLLADLPA